MNTLKLNRKDTLLDKKILKASEIFYNNVYAACNETGEESDETTDHPSLNFQTSKALQ